MVHTFHRATQEDIEAIVSIEFDLFPENNFNEKTIAQQIAAGFIDLIYVDDVLAAYAVCVGHELVDVLRLGVRKQYRRVGLATVLLDNIRKLGKDVMLTVLKENASAIALYKKHGFEIVATMPQFNSWLMMRKADY